MTVKVLLYKGNSWVSKAIQFQTRSPYSHAALQFSAGATIEAWHIGGVRRLGSPFDGHGDGTVIDVYRLDGFPDLDDYAISLFLTNQIGKKYDFSSVGRFLSRRQTQADDKWFCSELVLAALEAGGARILNIAPSLATPRDIGISPYLNFEKTLVS